MAMTEEERQAALDMIRADREANPELTLSPEEAAKATVKPGVGTSIGAMAYKGLSGLTGGGSDYLWRALLPRWAQIKLDKAVAASSPVLTTGAELAGAAASRLGRVGNLLKGAKTASTLGRIGTAAARGAIGAGAYAAPRAIGQLATGEEPASAVLSNVAEQAALGGALGGGFEAITSGLAGARGALAKYAPRMEEKLNETALKSVGIDAEAATRRLLRGSEAAAEEGGTAALKTSGALLREGDAIQGAAADLLKKNGIKSRMQLKEFVQANLDNPELATDKGFDLLKIGLGMGKKGAGSTQALKTLALLGVGGTAGLASKKFDIKDPSTWAAAGAGALAAAMAPRLGSQAAALKKYLPTAVEGAAPAAEGVGRARQILQNLAPRIPGAAAVLKPSVVPAAEPVAAVPGVSEVPGVPGEEKAVPAGYVQKLSDNLSNLWVTKFAKSGVSYDDFVKAIAARTDNFQDITKVAPILFPDKTERAKFLRDYGIVTKLQGMDIEQAYKGRKANAITEFFGGGNAAEGKMAYDSLVSTVASALAASGGLPTAAEEKAVKEDLDMIMALPPSAGDKRQLIIQKLGDYGLSLNTLQSLGLL